MNKNKNKKVGTVVSKLIETCEYAITFDELKKTLDKKQLKLWNKIANNIAYLTKLIG